MLDYKVVFETMATVLGALFSLWPLAVLAPIQRRRHILPNMIIAWGMMAVVRAISLFAPVQLKSLFIPEPFNTVLFFIIGIALFLLLFGQKYWRQRKVQIKADHAKHTADLLDLSPTEFEEMVVELYTRMGHKAQRTGAIGDHGVDVVVEATNGEKWIVQCKRWRGNVGEPVIRDFYGVMHHEKADKGAIITTGVFTPQARIWAQGKPITLLEGNEFLSYLRKTRVSTQKHQL